MAVVGRSTKGVGAEASRGVGAGPLHLLQGAGAAVATPVETTLI